MFTLEELILLKNGMDARVKVLETTLSHCRRDKTIGVVHDKLWNADMLIRKVDRLIKAAQKD